MACLNFTTGNGHCPFGEKCFFLHPQPVKPTLEQIQQHRRHRLPVFERVAPSFNKEDNRFVAIKSNLLDWSDDDDDDDDSVIKDKEDSPWSEMSSTSSSSSL